jgi:hypothetical protein
MVAASAKAHKAINKAKDKTGRNKTGRIALAPFRLPIELNLERSPVMCARATVDASRCGFTIDQIDLFSAAASSPPHTNEIASALSKIRFSSSSAFSRMSSVAG